MQEVRRVFLVLTNDLWAYVATAMDRFEANLRAGLEWSKRAKANADAGRAQANKGIVPGSQEDMAELYMQSLLDTHNGGAIDAQPCVDVSAYGHVAILVDALMLALPRLQTGAYGGAGGSGSAGGGAGSKSPFFRRTESVSVAGAPCLPA